MREDYWLETSLAFEGYNTKDYHFAFVRYYHYFLRLQWGLSLGFCSLQQGLSLGFCSLQQWLSLFVRLSQTLWSIGLKRSRLLAEKEHIWRKSHRQALLIFSCRKVLNIDLATVKIKFVEIIQDQAWVKTLLTGSWYIYVVTISYCGGFHKSSLDHF